MKRTSRSLVLLALFLGLFSASRAQADMSVGLGSGMTWLRSSALSNSGTPVFLTDIEIGASLQNKAGFLGAFVVGNFTQGTNVSFPYMWGFAARIYFGNTRFFMIGARLDPIAMIYMLSQSTSRSWWSTFSWSFDVGFRIPLGKSVSLVPYVDYREFSYPYSLVIVQPRYGGLEAGMRIVFGQ